MSAELQRLLAGLAAADAETRRRALAGLPGQPPAAALAPVIEALGDGDWRVRKEATLRLAAWPDGEAAAAALVGALRGPGDVGRRNAAVDALGRLGASALPALLAEHERGGGHAKLVIDALAAVAEPAAVPALARLLGHTDPNLRVAAAEALRATGGAAAAAALRTCLGAADRDLRLAAL
ncbi:MAG TPA: HEAT repeat domain-containing protein, partial [Kofleriaceae bacterium]|nr:HEAT repeat domain-containing protein [Kofleriaceae bacterium]